MKPPIQRRRRPVSAFRAAFRRRPSLRGALLLSALLSAAGPALAEPVPAPSRSGPVAQATEGIAPGAPVLRAPADEAAEDRLPDVELTAQVVFQVLAAEVALQRGQLSAAAGAYLDLARRTADPRLARRAVELSLAERALDRATSAAQLWVQSAPNSRLAAQTLETLHLSAGQYDKAEPLVTRRLADARRDGTLADAYTNLARVLLRTPDRQAARALLARVAEPDAKVPEAWLARATVAHAAEAFDEATVAARRAHALAPESEPVVVALARHLQRTPEGSAEATRLLTGFLARQPKAVEARFQLARVHAAEGRLDDARAQFERVLQDDPNNPSTLFSLAQVAYQAKQTKDAERYLARYLDLPRTVRRDNVPAYLFLAQIAEDERRLPEAIDWLGRVGAGEQFLPALTRRAQLLARIDRVDEARSLLRDTAVGSNRDRLQLTVAEAQILRDANRVDEAFDVLDRALAGQPDNPELLYEHALTAERIGRHELMEAGLRKLIGLRPDHAHAYNALGYSLAERYIRLQEAQELIEKALTLSPDDPFILDSMGWVHFRLGRNDKALEYLQRAYGMRQDVEIAVHLGEVLWVMGRTEEARRLWAEARGREPANETLKSTLARLNVSL